MVRALELWRCGRWCGAWVGWGGAGCVGGPTCPDTPSPPPPPPPEGGGARPALGRGRGWVGCVGVRGWQRCIEGAHNPPTQLQGARVGVGGTMARGGCGL